MFSTLTLSLPLSQRSLATVLPADLQPSNPLDNPRPPRALRPVTCNDVYQSHLRYGTTAGLTYQQVCEQSRRFQAQANQYTPDILIALDEVVKQVAGFERLPYYRVKSPNSTEHRLKQEFKQHSHRKAGKRKTTNAFSFLNDYWGGTVALQSDSDPYDLLEAFKKHPRFTLIKITEMQLPQSCLPTIEATKVSDLKKPLSSDNPVFSSSMSRLTFISQSNLDLLNIKLLYLPEETTDWQAGVPVELHVGSKRLLYYTTIERLYHLVQGKFASLYQELGFTSTLKLLAYHIQGLLTGRRSLEQLNHAIQQFYTSIAPCTPEADACDIKPPKEIRPYFVPSRTK